MRSSPLDLNRSLAVSFLVVCVLMPIAASAQVAGFERKLLPIKSTIDALEHAKDFWDALKFLREAEDRQRSLKGAVKFSFNGDEAGPQSLFKLSTGIELSRGLFPAELSVDSELGLQLKDGELQEDVTTLRINYDFHTKPWLEYFGFAQRFSDSFLSIEQRYEVGFGARFGFYMGKAGNHEKTAEHFNNFDKHLSPVEAALAKVETEKTVKGVAALTKDERKALDGSIKHLKQSFVDRESLFFLGVATSLFTELERAELEVPTRPAEGAAATTDTKKKFSLPSEYRYRLSIRPTLRVRPGDGLLLTIYPYFKLPLDAPRRIDVDGTRRLDYRRDVFTKLAWSLEDEQTGHENVEFAFKFDHYFDNIPPAISPETIATELAAGRILDRTRAERSHSVVGIELTVKWGS